MARTTTVTAPSTRFRDVTIAPRTRVAAALVVAALAAAGATQIATAAKGGGGGAKPSSAKPLVVSGFVEGLYPGATSTLLVTVTNDNNVAIAVASMRVDASDAGPDCPASVLMFTPPAPGQVIAARATATVPVAVAMASDAPDACQGATFPLRHTVTGAKAR